MSSGGCEGGGTLGITSEEFLVARKRETHLRVNLVARTITGTRANLTVQLEYFFFGIPSALHFVYMKNR